MANSLCKVLLTDAPLEGTKQPFTFSAGAVVDFSGIVRRVEDGREIDGIQYEAHREMAEHQLRQIAELAVAKFGLQLVLIHHRIGFIAVGEPSLFVRVAARHRQEAFRASQWIVNELKKKVPIWKLPAFANQPSREAMASREATAGKPR
jgi:molybdopterin synthase catalytic subunit